MLGGLRKLVRDCDRCEQLANPENYPKGVRVRIAEAFDCDNCEVTKYQPIVENENILELYNALPQNYDGYSGLRILDANAIKFLFELFEVPKELQDSYYMRLVYLHGEVVEASSKAREKEKKRQDDVRKWKNRGLKSHKIH